MIKYSLCRLYALGALFTVLILFAVEDQAQAAWRSSWDTPLGMENCIDKQPPPPPFVKIDRDAQAGSYRNQWDTRRLAGGSDDPLENNYDFDADNITYDPVPDPLESWNRFWFAFNDVLYTVLWRPLIITWETIAPAPVRTSIKNFFHNLAFPIRFVSLLLQGRFQAAGVEFSRFIMNSTFGIGGLFDPASRLETRVDVEDTDLGQAFASWGIGHGIYLVLPVIGPSSLRDGIGLVGGAFLEPPGYYLNWYESAGLEAGNTVNSMTFSYDSMEAIHEAAVDPYLAFRDAYLQYREANKPR